ncbi:MAG: hypothetical protein FWD40_06490 [Treponema sp.]|nr:hypothetical protein [Treponema sp.]
MKKFLITLFILIILGATAFLFGWVQFSVPPGQYGIIISKTHGTDGQLVRSGEFRWLWYKLIPTNVKIAIFDLEQKRYTISFNSALPSGDTYASFAGLANADFSWNLQGEISFKMDPNALVSLAENNNITNQEELDNYLRTAAQSIEVIILRMFSSEADSERLERILSGNRDQRLETDIKNAFPWIIDFSLVINSAKYPDFVLYSMLRLLYEEFLARQREYISNSFGRRAESHIETQLRFEELERYGDLLTRFPVLLEYFALEINKNQ